MAVFGWLNQPQASYPQLRLVAASLDVAVSTQAVEQRFGPASAALLRELLHRAVGEVLGSEGRVSELLGRFNGVYVQVRLDLAQGGMQGPWLQAGRQAERSGEAHETPLPEGCLYNVDSGYCTLAEMRAHGKAGRYWLTTPKAGTLLIDERGQCWDLASFLAAQTGEEVDVWVYLGKRERLPVRLIARRGSEEQARRRRANAPRSHEGPPKGVQRPNARTRHPGEPRSRQRKKRKTSARRLRLLEWTILITNVPQDRLSVQEALVLARCRWQIELCWKLWKQVGKVDTWRSAKPFRILSEMYAKLLGCLVTHWVTLIECWQAPNRSLGKARQVMQWMAPVLALGVAGVVPLEAMVGRTAHAMATGCTINARKSRPAVYQLIANPKLNSS